MKALKQICIAFLIMIVAVSAVTAQTENKDLPPEKELRSFIDGIDASDNYLSYITELSQTEHPTWKWDLWSDRVMNKFDMFCYSAFALIWWGCWSVGVGRI